MKSRQFFVFEKLLISIFRIIFQYSINLNSNFRFSYRIEKKIIIKNLFAQNSVEQSSSYCIEMNFYQVKTKSIQNMSVFIVFKSYLLVESFFLLVIFCLSLYFNCVFFCISIMLYQFIFLLMRLFV